MEVKYILYFLILQKRDADVVNYAALNFSTRKSKGMKRTDSPLECMYSTVSVVQYTLQEPSWSRTCMWQTHSVCVCVVGIKYRGAWVCIYASVDVAALYVLQKIK